MKLIYTPSRVTSSVTNGTILCVFFFLIVSKTSFNISDKLKNLVGIVLSKIDVYSFGVLLCEISTGELPDPEWREQQVRSVNNSNYRAVIQRCQEPDAGMRANMEHIIDELETFKLMGNFRIPADTICDRHHF